MNPQQYKILNEIFRKIIGKHIRNSRLMWGLTQEEAAERIGCSAKHLGRIERGEKTPKGLMLSLIQLKLDLRSDDYLKEFEEAIKKLEKGK
ncbi:helix-turn-helix domain-containing protein [Pseudogracilibacillus auburnensis]|uniref:Helix-turn-helix protein n=1 Tax=Pseudogracilibacillus auburnensis TaxID=1494959 RepID=A0A2V3VQJ2_9BACI|nr:helix-turn-helix transcriptional regulator [Pseudogracilibacillus auburnensis]MBO1001800.1 helix-turn-helix domain-containing protein [Pseudogracilibacillus auburnensis]PXW83414.1 helix-turn-helix protein [Pseudogracilibacillus auburnensis]